MLELYHAFTSKHKPCPSKQGAGQRDGLKVGLSNPLDILGVFVAN
jgi:hypothetical protein